jgi:hypothetical protein
MKVTGYCHCGAISFEAEVDPAQVRVCHCIDCQRMSGSAFRANVTTLPGSFSLKSGAARTYVKTAESGNQRAQAFCPDCGTHLWASDASEDPTTVGLRVGTLDQRAELRPSRQIWVRSALPWSMDLTGLPRAERQQ